jgi:superfamily II DNA/RNA helicase
VNIECFTFISLFEQGFAAQIAEISGRLPSQQHHQTILTSATMPSALSSFLKASALRDATVVSLDSERVLSPLLTSHFFYCHSTQKTAALVLLLQTLVDLRTQQVLVFAATRCGCVND